MHGQRERSAKVGTFMQAKDGISNWMRFYNTQRRHQGLANQAPDFVFFGGLNMPLAA